MQQGFTQPAAIYSKTTFTQLNVDKNSDETLHVSNMPECKIPNNNCIPKWI